MTIWSRFKPEYRSLALLIGGYVLVFFALAWRKYAVFGTDSGDIGGFVWMLRGTIQGQCFPHPIGASNFGFHPAFLWIQVLPFYYLFPTVPTLLFLQTLLLGLTAIPIYLIARHLMQQHWVALVLAAAFLLFPPIVSANLNQVEEPPLYAVYLLLAAYFFAKERFGLFMLFAAIACLGRETVPLAVAMFGVCSLILRRKKIWIFAPLVMGGTYFWFLISVLMPYFRYGLPWHAITLGFFSYLGDSPRAIVFNALTHPLVLTQHLLSQENLTYLVLLVQPLGWILPFFTPAWLMALPDLAINTLSTNGAFKVIPWHYNMITGCGLFVGAIYGVRKIGHWLRSRSGGNPELVMAVALLVFSIAHWFIWFNPQHYRRLPQHAALLRALDSIPPDKSLIAPLRLQGHIANREHYHNIGLFPLKPDCAAQFEYVILDANERQYQPMITREFFDQFYRNQNYQLLSQDDNVFVFRRMGKESDWKIPVYP